MPDHSWRLFVAVDPSGEARLALGRLQARLRDACAAAGWRVSCPCPGRLHLTLRFLGDVAPRRAEEMGRALQVLGSTDRFEIALGTLGAFPGEKKPRILWIAPTRGAGALKSLAEQVDRCFARLGAPPEPRQFQPHLTLARVRQSSGSAAHVLQTVSPGGPIVSPISEVVLYRSDLLPSGARYTPRVRVPLGTG